MRRYFKAYVRQESKRRLAAATLLQRATRCHAARETARALLCSPASAPPAATPPAKPPAPSSLYAREVPDVGTRAVRAGVLRGMATGRFSVRQACAVQCQALFRGGLVRLRLRKHLSSPPFIPHSPSAGWEGGGGERQGGWVPKTPNARGGGRREGVRAVAPSALLAEVAMLRRELDEERSARRQQDEALRLLWSEVAELSSRRRRDAV
ncbi:hypothetical protein T484DRAFT_1896562, partial [Baffinella frigidus]